MGIENTRYLKDHADDPKPKKIYKIAKVSKKRLAKLEAQKEMAILDEAFYKEIWLAWPHRCYECNSSLGKHPYNWMFHHLLEKHLRPDLRHIPENIVLLCLEHHDQAHRQPGKLPKTEQRKVEIEKMFPL